MYSTGSFKSRESVLLGGEPVNPVLLENFNLKHSGLHKGLITVTVSSRFTLTCPGL